MTKEPLDTPEGVFETIDMSEWPASTRDDGLVERVCGHGVGHPDPDSVEALGDGGLLTHGCDGCCHGRGTDEPTQMFIAW